MNYLSQVAVYPTTSMMFGHFRVRISGIFLEKMDVQHPNIFGRSLGFLHKSCAPVFFRRERIVGENLDKHSAKRLIVEDIRF